MTDGKMCPECGVLLTAIRFSGVGVRPTVVEQCLNTLCNLGLGPAGPVEFTDEVSFTDECGNEEDGMKVVDGLEIKVSVEVNGRKVRDRTVYMRDDFEIPVYVIGPYIRDMLSRMSDELSDDEVEVELAPISREVR